MRRLFPILVLILLFILMAMVVWISNRLDRVKNVLPASPAKSQVRAAPSTPTASESLLVGYGDAATPPIEDLRKIHRVVTGYFSLIKDAQRFPIGGNEDLSAALRGENPNREIFVRAGSPVFSRDGLLIDRWGSPLIIHPQAWRALELRSAGPDRVPYNADDLVLSPAGISSQGK